MNDYEIFQQRIENGSLERDHNYPGGAWYDPSADEYFNSFGQQLRPIEEYDEHSEGYTPFGDE